MAGWFGQGQGYGDGGLMGKLTEDDGPTWKARLTGIPDSAPAAQGQVLAMALAQAAGAIGQANQPGYGRRNTGDLLAIGMGGFGQGLGMQAMQRQRAAVEQAKVKMAEAQAQREAEAHELKMKAGGLGGDAANLAILLGRQPTAEEFMAFKHAPRSSGGGGSAADPQKEALKQLQIDSMNIMLQKPREQWTPDDQRIIETANAFGMFKGDIGGSLGGSQGAPNKAQEDDDKKQLGEVRESISGAESALAQYDTALSLLDNGVQTGPLFSVKKGVGQVASALGMNPQYLAKMEALESSLESIRLNLAKYMKGAISDSEQEILRRAAGGTALSPEGLREVLTTARNIEMRNMQNAVSRRDYFEKHNTFSGYRSPKAAQITGSPAAGDDGGWEDI